MTNLEGFEVSGACDVTVLEVASIGEQRHSTAELTYILNLKSINEREQLIIRKKAARLVCSKRKCRLHAGVGNEEREIASCA